MRNIPDGLLILGFGGHARSVADVALSCGIRQLLFIDENAREGESFQGFPVQKVWPPQPLKSWVCLGASGDSIKRQTQIIDARNAGWPIGVLIAKTATVGAGAFIAEGCFVGQHAHIGPMALVNEACIINTGAIVEHDCIVGDYSHISVNATVAGRCRIGSSVFIGAGATVIDSIEICSNATIGAGSVVIRNITRAGIFVGIPTQSVNSNSAV